MKNRVVISSIRRVFILLMMCLGTTMFAKADEISVECSAPSSVAVGRNFQVAYTINSGADDITVPDMENFVVLMGPSTMTSSSHSFVNGKVQSSRQTTFTYVLRATTVGTFTIPAAKVTSGGKTYQSNSVKVTVVQGEAQPQSQGGPQQGADRSTTSSDDLYIRQTLTRSSVYEGEATELVTKVYTRVSLQSLTDLQQPKLSDFVSNDLGDNNITFQTEYINGREYEVGVLSRKSIIPQKSGKITIEPTEAEFVVRRRVRSAGGSIFDDIFGGDTQLNRRRVKSSPVTLNVKPLPNGKPSDFSGGVGQFRFKVDVTPSETKVDNSVQVRISVEGQGNLKILTMPKPQFHQDFDSFDPSSKNNIEAVAGGFSGRRTDEYLIIPRRDGIFEIPQIQFSYFDPQNGKYVKLTQGPFKINVAKGDGAPTSQGSISFSGSGPEKITYSGSDLRYLHKSGSLSEKNTFFVLSPLFWVLTLLPVGALAVLTVVYRKKMYDNANVNLVRSRKANKTARKRLKQAAKYIKEDKREAFFDEVMRALWGYLSDKLTMPLSELTKDNARDKMSEHGVDTEAADEFMSLLEECEFARYAPASVTATMDEVYSKAADVIEKIETNKKK